MANKSNLMLSRLSDFRIKNVRMDEPFEAGTKRLQARNILRGIQGSLMLGCTDERAVKEVFNPKSGKRLNQQDYTIARAVGGVCGLVDAIRNVRVTIQRQDILEALKENEVLAANHTDTHAKEGELTGCGYSALRALSESGSIFDRPTVEVSERMRAYEEDGALRMVLEGEHVAQGLVINPYYDRVLDPGLPEAECAFFSMDIGIYREILHWIEGALGFGEGAVRTVLVKLTRNNLAAVFMLSGSEINEAIYIEREDDQDAFFTGVVHEGLAELRERGNPVMRVLEQRMASG